LVDHIPGRGIVEGEKADRKTGHPVHIEDLDRIQQVADLWTGPRQDQQVA